MLSMANTKSAKKELRKAARRRVFNLRRKRAMKRIIKEVRKLIEEKQKEKALELIPALYKAIDKAAKRGVIKKNTAARKKSRILKAINSL